MEEIKQKEFERFMQEFMYEIRETNNYYVLENMMKDYISQALKKRDSQIIEIIKKHRGTHPVWDTLKKEIINSNN